MKPYFLIPILCLCAPISLAWNSIGHRVIAQIAYDNLTSAVKAKVDSITKEQFYFQNPDTRFLKAATWPDELKSTTHQYDTWHYINLPDVYDGVNPPPIDPQNVVFEINQQEQALKNRETLSPRQQAKDLSFLIHFIGDIHQPLHCIDRFSKNFPAPRGDEGGNLYPIQSGIANNLHALWDSGVGLFYFSHQQYRHYLKGVPSQAEQLEAEYPPAYFAQKLLIHSPQAWAQESFDLAKANAYTLPENNSPNGDYVRIGQQISAEQAALAGYRLANVLNGIFSG